MTERDIVLARLQIQIILVAIAFCVNGIVCAANRPNIVLLMGDDHGWDETGYNGHPFLKTPTLDAMAANGLRFERFYSAHPSCSPTRGSVLTGRNPNRYGAFNSGWSIRPEEVTIAHILRDAGYSTAHFGKWHLGPIKADSPTNPGAMGFEHWLSHDNFFELDPVLSRDGGPPQVFRGEGSEVIVDQAIKYLSQVVKEDRPFLVVIWYGSPHEPYSGLAKDLDLYRDLPSKYRTPNVRVTSNETGLQVRRPLGEVLQERYAEITAMDRSIGQLRDWLTERGLRDDTLLWYCSDNGSSYDGSVTSPFRESKGNIYEGGVRVPGVIEWPAGLTTQHVLTTNATTSDILPTVCDLLDLALPDRPIDGESLTPIFDSVDAVRSHPICFWKFNRSGGALQGLTPYIDGELQQGTTPLVKLLDNSFIRSFENVRFPNIHPQHYSGDRAILDGRYKLVIRDTDEESSTCLYDIASDQSEENDLAKKFPERTQKLKDRLHDWQQSVLKSLTGADY